MYLIIYGASGFGREIKDLANKINISHKFFDEILFVDNLYKGNKIDNYEIYSTDEIINNIKPSDAKLVVAMGEPKFRAKFRTLFLSKGFEMQTLIHPSVEIGHNTQIGNGVIIQKGAILTTDIIIHDNVIIQYNATVAHEVEIGEDSFIASNATISGNVKIGKRTYIAIDVPIRQGINIGDDVTIGMGSCVSRDVPSNAVTIGNPLKILKDFKGYNVFK